MEKQEIKEQGENREDEEKKRNGSGFLGKFTGVFLLVCLFAAGIFFLLAWISYNRRYSAEFIRAGLVLVYIIPCLLGGRILRHLAKERAFLWGALLGGCFFAAVLVLSVLVKGITLQADRIRLAPLVLCIVCGIAGSLRLHGKEKEHSRL